MNKPRSSHLAILAAMLVAIFAAPPRDASAAIIGPYTGSESGTLHLWHFDEAASASTAANSIGGGFGLTKTNGATLGNAGYSGFGSAGATPNATSVLQSGSNVAPSQVSGANGAFTFEALIKVSTITGSVQPIMTMSAAIANNNTDQAFQWNISSGGNLSFFTIQESGASTNSSISAAIPTTGADAFVANEWFHVAVAYNGNQGDAGNATLYWTRVDASRTQANLLTTASFANDLFASQTDSRFAVGNRTNGASSNRLLGSVDEVRVSSVARGAGDFIFFDDAPEIPAPAALPAGLAMIGLIAARRRRG